MVCDDDEHDGDDDGDDGDDDPCLHETMWQVSRLPQTLSRQGKEEEHRHLNYQELYLIPRKD